MSWYASLGKATKQYVLILRKDPCSYCGKVPTQQQPGTIDHIIPKSVDRKGRNWWENLTAACKHCNNSLRLSTPMLLFLIEQHRRSTRKQP